MQPDVNQQTIRDVGQAAMTHMAWLKSIHTALMFHEDVAAPPVEVPAILDEWVEATFSEKAVKDRQAAVARLRCATERMHDWASRLTTETRQGRIIERTGYMGFMTSVENFQRQLRALEALLRQSLAETDPLTGVSNRQGMMRDLERERNRMIRTGQPCSLVLTDLDHFKRVNDIYGHLAGDKVLRTAARFFSRKLRPYDLVFRFGGEEFLFCLPNTDIETARHILERLRSLMNRVPVHLDDGTKLVVTASFGIAGMAENRSLTDTIAEADVAVYAAKTGGRNRVVVSGERIEAPLRPAGAALIGTPASAAQEGEPVPFSPFTARDLDDINGERRRLAQG
ncbi:MAG: diguanylate cyclase [Rhodospirillales bacterium]|nr:diguanylate cyclase [Rhodospirillales bacterium]